MAQILANGRTYDYRIKGEHKAHVTGAGLRNGVLYLRSTMNGFVRQVAFRKGDKCFVSDRALLIESPHGFDRQFIEINQEETA